VYMYLRMRCPHCGRWNRIAVNKILVEQPSPEPKVKVFIVFYEPVQVSNCGKCRRIIAEPKELIRITSATSCEYS